MFLDMLYTKIEYPQFKSACCTMRYAKGSRDNLARRFFVTFWSCAIET